MKKLSNKQLIESALDYIITETNYTIYDIHYDDTYFVIKDERNSICQFKIKEIPGFLFAFWNVCRFDSIDYQLKHKGIGNTWADSLNISPKSELVFFTQYLREIDKFKPSASAFVEGIYRISYKEDNKEIVEWNADNVADVLKYMHKHPLKAYYYSTRNTASIFDEQTDLRIIIEYIKDYVSYNKCEYQKRRKYKSTLKRIKAIIKKLKYSDAIVQDMEDWSPRLEVYIRSKKDATDEEFTNDYDLLEAFYQKYFNDLSLTYYEVFKQGELSDADWKQDEKLYDKFYNEILFQDNTIYTNIKDHK